MDSSYSVLGLSGSAWYAAPRLHLMRDTPAMLRPAAAAMLDPMAGWDMHEDPATQVPEEHGLPAGARVSATADPGNCGYP
jgi:hypothetical protein